jgi:4-amino-4-deoxy-L-arabinose transferase-like glycosyltransferase
VKLPALPSLKLPERIGWRDHLVGALLALAYVAWLLATARSLGFPRDEGMYFRAGSEYMRWVRLLFDHSAVALEPGTIDSSWSTNHEHPVLFKTLFGASHYLFHETWHLFTDGSTAYRLPGMASAGLALWVTYLFGARAWGREVGLVAALLLGLMPRVFFHAHLACFDVPITAMWILCVYLHWRALETRRLGFALATGLAFGLALETKHNAWLLPFALVPHALFVERLSIWRALKVGRVTLPASVVAMATISPLVFLALWPFLWHDTIPRIEAYFDFHLHHEYYNIEFLGRNYFGPPSPKSYLPVMVVATVPAVTLLLFLVGAADRATVGAARVVRAAVLWNAGALEWAERRWKSLASPRPRDRAETDLLLALSFCVAVGPFFLAKTPIFGGTKHWLPAYPVLALLAGRGFQLALQAMRRALPQLAGWRRWGAEVGLGACVVLAPLAVTAHSHPFGLSAYVPIVGGTAGGADLGLNRQFWGFTTQTAAEEYLNPKAPRGASVFFLDTTWDAWARMQEEGRVRSDLRGSGAPGDALLSLVQHELHMSEVDYDIWITDGTDAPAYVLEHDGVPIVSVYRKQ